MGDAASSADVGDGVEGRAVSGFIVGSFAPAASGLRPMAIGYNHDVPHQGRVYHVQTEDSGRSRRRIITHVFHAGTIVASSRTDYGDAATAPDVVALLQTSHKSMMRQLVQGSLDDAIVRCLGEPSRPEPRHGPRGDGPPRRGQASRELRAELQALIETLDMDGVDRALEAVRGSVAGTLGVALVDYETGMCLGTSGAGIDLHVAAAGNTDVMKAKARIMRVLGIAEGIEDMLITLDSQYHVIRPVGTTFFLYLALDRAQGNLAFARHKLAAAAAELKV